jgi:hypothetical protein
MIVEAEGANPDAFAIRTARESVPGNRFQQLPPLGTTFYSISPRNPLNAIQPLVHGLLHLDHRVSRSSPYGEQPLRTALWASVTPFALLD